MRQEHIVVFEFQLCSTLLEFGEMAQALKLHRDSQLTYLFIL